MDLGQIINAHDRRLRNLETKPAVSYGMQGTQGLTGIQGPDGVTGATGATGLQGMQGTQGIQGNQGTQGTIGIQGPSSQVSIQSLSQTDTSMYPVLVANNATGAQNAVIDSADLYYDSSAGHLYLGSGGFWSGGRTSTSMAALGNTGCVVGANGTLYATHASSPPLSIHNETSNGNLIALYTNATQIATVSSSGGTVTWGTFCGAHWSQAEGFDTSSALLGTVVETTGDLCSWDEDHVPNTNLPKVKVSDTPKSKNVYGVYSHIDIEDDLGDIFIAALGAFYIRVSANESVALGDLLESGGNGCAVVQQDDIVRSSTIGKVISTSVYQTYEDGSYVVPCVLYCG